MRNLTVRDKILSSNSVSIHVRRGDYLQLINERLLVCDSHYYERAIDEIARRIENPCFFIFSDDIEWCKIQFSYLPEKTFIDWNRNFNSYKDMHLMSLCKYNIIANSSFSWWAAWLNNYPQKIVIAPRLWFNDRQDLSYVPPSWIKV
jgi:hypothetical protein